MSDCIYPRSTDGRALQFASPQLRANKEVVMLAVVNNRDAFRFESDALQNGPDIRRLAEGNALEDILDLT